MLDGCDLELAAVDAVLDACRAALAGFSTSMDADRNALQQLLEDSSAERNMDPLRLRRMSILQLRLQERRILNRTVSVLISQRRQLSASGRPLQSK